MPEVEKMDNKQFAKGLEKRTRIFAVGIIDFLTNFRRS